MKPTVRALVFRALAAGRGFPGGFWHPKAVDEMCELIEGVLTDMGLPDAAVHAAARAAATASAVMDDDELDRALIAARRVVDAAARSNLDPNDTEEDRERGEQIARAVASANTTLKQLGDDRRFVAFGSDDLDECFVLVTEAEARQLAEA